MHPHVFCYCYIGYVFFGRDKNNAQNFLLTHKDLPHSWNWVTMGLKEGLECCDVSIFKATKMALILCKVLKESVKITEHL